MLLIRKFTKYLVNLMFLVIFFSNSESYAISLDLLIIRAEIDQEKIQTKKH